MIYDTISPGEVQERMKHHALCEWNPENRPFHVQYGRMNVKRQAAELATTQGVDSAIVNGKSPDAPYLIAKGEGNGTLFAGGMAYDASILQVSACTGAVWLKRYCGEQYRIDKLSNRAAALRIGQLIAERDFLSFGAQTDRNAAQKRCAVYHPVRLGHGCGLVVPF